MEFLQQDLSQVEIATQSSVSLFPSEDELKQNADILIQAGEYFLCRSLLARSLQFYPKSSVLLSQMAHVAESLEDRELALKCYKAILNQEGTVETALKCSSLLQEFQQYDDAKQVLFQILSEVHLVEFDLFQVFKEIGNICIKMGDLDSAEEYYDKAFALRPNSQQLLVNYGTLELQRNNYEAALLRFREALAIDASYANAWVGLAFIHRSYGDMELSLANVICALDHEPENRTALRLFSEWSISLGRIEQAVGRIEAFLMRHPQDFEFSLLFAKMSVILGRYPAAWAAAQMAATVDPTSTDAQAVLEEIESRTKQAGIQL